MIWNMNYYETSACPSQMRSNVCFCLSAVQQIANEPWRDINKNLLVIYILNYRKKKNCEIQSNTDGCRRRVKYNK